MPFSGMDMSSWPLKMGSIPINILLPEWILHFIFFKKYYSIFWRLSQIAYPCLVPIDPVLNQYSRFLPFMYFNLTVILHDPSPKIPLHNDLHRSALKKALKSINPQPPRRLGEEILSILARWNFRYFDLPPQIKLAKTLFILWMMPAGR